jgi:chaperonin GroES
MRAAALPAPGVGRLAHLPHLVERKQTVTKVRPLHDRLLVRRLKGKETTRTGIAIPDSAREKPQSGEVLAVGSGTTLENGLKIAPEVKPGDRILFDKYAGTDLKIDGDEVLIVREDEVLAIETKD